MKPNWNPPEDDLILKSNYPLKGIIFNPVEEAKSFFQRSYLDSKRVKIEPKATEFYHLISKHLGVHASLSCELCSTLRHFLQARGYEK